MQSHDIHWLHVEASSKCNAWCPACARNNKGFGLAPNLVEQDLQPHTLQSIVSSLPNLKVIQFCGNLGDPIASAHFIELLHIAKQSVQKIQIHTNGSLRSTKWWQQLANKLSDIDHDVWFGLDGLEDTHEIYRQGTSFKKIIANAKSFIDAGGYATWQFIPYKHNEHQVMPALKMSQKLGFKKFHLAKLYRKQTLARHFKTGQEFELLPTESLAKITNIDRIKKQPDQNQCMHLQISSIYVAATGKISRCCYFSSHEKYDTVQDFLGKATIDLSNKTCIMNCG